MKARLVTLAIAMLMIVSLFPSVAPTAAQDGFNLTVTPGCGYNDLVWDAVPNAAHYWIYRGPGVGMEYATPLTDFPIKETHFRDTINIQNDQLYCYYVRAVDSGANEFAQSIEDCGTPTCPPEEDDCVRILKYQVGNTMYWVDDGEKGPMEAAPVINQSRMFLLIRYVAEEMGATVDYVASERKIIITTTDHNVIEIWIGKPTAAVNGQPVQIDPNNPSVVGYVVNGRTLLPMRFVAENLGATGPNDIKWFSDTSTVVLYFDDPECRECKCMTIASVDTYSNPPSAVGTDGSGISWNLSFEGSASALAAKLETGMCYEVCGYIQANTEGGEIGTPAPGTSPVGMVARPDIFRVTSIRGVECPCEPENDGGKGGCELCVHVVEVGIDEAYVTDEWGVKWVLFKAPSLAAEFMEGSCINVEGNLVEGKHGFPGFEVTQIKEGTCCDEPPKVECVCVIIDNKFRVNDNFFVASGTTEDGETLGLMIPRDLAYSMNNGECWKVCGEIVEQDNSGEIGTPMPGPRKGMKVEEAFKEDCCGEPKTECVCVTIKTKTAINDNLVIMTGDTADMTWSLVVERNLASDMQIGECWKVCGTVVVQTGEIGTPTPGKSMRVTEAFLEDCCDNTDPDCICVKIDEVHCYYDPPTVDATDMNGNTWKLYVNNDMCPQMMAGQCWYVCGKERVNDGITTPMPYKEMDVRQIKPGGDCCGGNTPPPENCTWYPVEIFSAERTGTSDLPWKVSLKICGDDDVMGVFDEYQGSDDIRVDKSGKHKIFDYKGCAKVCVVDKRITDWIALPLVKNCCGGGNENPPEKPNRKVCEGKKIFGTVTNNPAESDVIYVSECTNPNDNMGVILFGKMDMMDTTGEMAIKDIKKGACAIFCVDDSGRSLNVTSWTSVSVKGDCCTALKPPKIVVGEITKLTDNNSDIIVWMSECPKMPADMSISYSAPADLKDTTGKYTFKDYGIFSCAILKVKGHRVISWTAMAGERDCCDHVLDGTVITSSKNEETGDLFVSIKKCDDGFQHQYYVEPGMMDIHGQMTIGEYVKDRSYCIRVYTYDRRIVAWQSMRDVDCCVKYGYRAKIIFNGFTNESNLENVDAVMSLEFKACKAMKTKGLTVQPGLRDETGLYTFRTLPEASCISVKYSELGRILSWEYLKHDSIGDCCNN